MSVLHKHQPLFQIMNSEYEFAIFYNQFISDLLQRPHAAEMRQLLLVKKAQSDKELLALYQTCRKRNACLQEIKYLKKSSDCLGLDLNVIAAFIITTDCVLLSLIGQLPEDIVRLIGAYSNHVKNQKSLVRIEFYDNWFKLNRDRITKLLKGWSKAKLGFVLDKIRSPNNPYYNCCKKTLTAYKKGTELMFRSRIETLIVEKGNRSHLEQYSLLLAIEKYNGKI
jgi:hypothetical protein